MYLIVNKVFGFVSEKNNVKYLKIDKGEILNKWDQVFIAIKYHIRKINNEEEVNFDSDLGKVIYFRTLTVVIRCVFKQGDIFYPQVYFR